MAKRELTAEELESRKVSLAKGRETAAANRAARRPTEEFPAPVLAIAETGEPLPEIRIEEPELLDDFGRFLVSLDAETRALLGDDELRTIYIAEAAKAAAEKKAAAKLAVKSRAEHHAKVEAGLLPTSVIEDAAWRARMNEKVRFTVDLPEFGDIGLRIDQRIFLHGQSYTMSRAEYDSFRSIVYQNQQAELTFEGRGRNHWLRRQARGSMGGEMIDGVAVE